MLYRLVQQQATLLAITDLYSGLGIAALISIVFVLLFRKVKVDTTHLSH
jgi:hypothetical protein